MNLFIKVFPTFDPAQTKINFVKESSKIGKDEKKITPYGKRSRNASIIAPISTKTLNPVPFP